ncbi:MAG: ATP-binding protein [Candidatus Woesearchaeota archaeon]|nr:ATP-binding protein [Candidatus Woesearchaeota archaeon]
MTYVKRDIEVQLTQYLDAKEIIAVVGPRQCGKTTLVTHFLRKRKNVNTISFDDIKQLSLFEHDIDSFIELNVRGYKYLFIDEVQYAKESGKKLKYIYDTQDIKIFISGSSAPELSISSMKYLVGRIFIFKLYPFSFNEFLRAKNAQLEKLYSRGAYKEEILKQLNVYLREFLLYGGYPRVALAKDDAEKQTVLQNLYNTYLLKEIKEILGLQENDKLVKLLKALSLQIGNLLNYNELSTITGFSYVQLKKYLQILEETYVTQRISTFHMNKRTELVKTPKIYFIDLGFRNICIDNFAAERVDLGAMYENTVFSEMITHEVKYWRTKAGAEVDFVINKTPIEIKSQLQEQKTTRSFQSFLEKYKPKKGFIVSQNCEGIAKKGNTTIHFVPFVKFFQRKHEKW